MHRMNNVYCMRGVGPCRELVVLVQGIMRMLGMRYGVQLEEKKGQQIMEEEEDSDANVETEQEDNDTHTPRTPPPRLSNNKSLSLPQTRPSALGAHCTNSLALCSDSASR